MDFSSGYTVMPALLMKHARTKKAGHPAFFFFDFYPNHMPRRVFARRSRNA